MEIVFNRLFLAWICLILTFDNNFVNGQYYPQNSSGLPYPYQTALGLPLGYSLPAAQNIGISSNGTSPFPYQGNYWTSVGIPNASQNSNNYYAALAQMGIPAYQYPPGMTLPQPIPGYPQPGLGYPQPGLEYSQPGIGYPQPGFGYPLPGTAYPQTSVGYPTGGFGYPQTGIGYPQQVGTGYPQPNQGNSQQGTGQPLTGSPSDQYANIKTEIIDVSPEYQRQLLGWPEQGSSGRDSGYSDQVSQYTKPRYNVKIDSQSSNFTQIPSNLTKPIITTKRYTTSIRRTFVYDSSKPGEVKPINLHIVNGEQITTTPPPTTTENEDVAETSTVKPHGRRFMDVPESCPRGTVMAHNGECIEPFFLAKLDLKKDELTTQGPRDI